MFHGILIGLGIGAIGASLAEYLIGYNLIDKILDLFRSEQTKAKNLVAQISAMQTKFAATVKTSAQNLGGTIGKL